MKKKDSFQFYVVNFFATPLTDYAKLFELQSKEDVSPMYDNKK